MTGNLAAGALRKRIPARWIDPILAGVFVLACELEALIDLHNDASHHHWPLAANVLLIAGLSAPIAWRRRAPLACASIVMLCVFVVTVSQNDVKNVTTPQLVLFIVPYSVAAYSSQPARRWALASASSRSPREICSSPARRQRRWCSASAPPPGQRG